MTHFGWALSKGHIQRHENPQTPPKTLKGLRITVGAAVNVVVLEAVRVAAEEDGGGLSVLHQVEKITPKFKHQTLDFRG